MTSPDHAPPSPPPQDEDPLVETVAGAYRPSDPRGGIGFLPAWYDLDAAGRERAFELARALRKLEAAADSRGVSSTGRAVLARIRAGGT
jgi:hypothetical protein